MPLPKDTRLQTCALTGPFDHIDMSLSIYPSVNDCFCNLNIWPFAFLYGGKALNVYLKGNITLLEAAYVKFVMTVFSLSLQNLVCSIAVIKEVHKLFGGKSYFDRF